MGKKQLLTTFIFIIYGCTTTGSKEKELSDALFRLQTRLLLIEQKLPGTPEALEYTNTLQNLQRELAFLRGEVDLLKRNLLPAATAIDLPPSISAPSLPSTPSTPPSLPSPTPPAAPVKESLQTAQDFEKAFKGAQYDLIIKFGEKALKKLKNKDKRLVNLLLAQSFLKKKNFGEAILVLDQGLRLAPKNEQPELSLLLGEAFLAMGDEKTAKIYFQDVIHGGGKPVEVKKARQALNHLEQTKKKSKK